MQQKQILADPSKVQLRKDIIRAVMIEHEVDEDEFFGLGRAAVLTDARRDAAIRLKKAGFSQQRIASILKRNHSTIDYYLYGKSKESKQRTANQHHILKSLPVEVSDIVRTIADARNVSAVRVLVEWLVERAACEAQTCGLA
jgi:predicted transcriptional regulator